MIHFRNATIDGVFARDFRCVIQQLPAGTAMSKGCSPRLMRAPDTPASAPSLLLESEFGAQTLHVPRNCRDRNDPAVVTIGRAAVLLLYLAAGSPLRRSKQA